MSSNVSLMLKRGYKDNLPVSINDGIIYYCIDSNELYFDYYNSTTQKLVRQCLNPMVGTTEYGDPVGKGLVSPEDKAIIDSAVRYVEQELTLEEKK